MNMLSIRVAVVLETLVGRIICGVKLFEKTISRKWLIPRVFVYLRRCKLKSTVRIFLFLLF